MQFTEENLTNLLAMGYDEAITSHIAEVVAYYAFLFNEPDACASCPSKIKSYWEKLQQSGIYLLKNKTMSKKIESKFKIKEGINFLQVDFGSSKFFNNDTITDELAIEHLSKNPKRISNFATYPSDWKILAGFEKEPLKIAKDLTLEKDDKESSDEVETILLFDKELTLEKAIEAFEKSMIETSAKTAKGLSQAFLKATDEEKESLKNIVLENSQNNNPEF